MLFGLLLLAVTFSVNAQSVEFKIITSVESIVPNGLGRSRLLSANDEKDYKEYMKKREQLKSLGKEHDARTLEQSKPTRGAKQVGYMEKLERLKAISEEKEREHEKENEQNDHDHERE